MNGLTQVCRALPAFPRPLKLFLSLVALVPLGACADSDAPPSQMREEAAPVFDQEHKIVARTLSLGNNTEIEKADTPYEQALLCSNAMSALSDRFIEAAGGRSDIVEGFGEAQAIYGRRLSALGSEEGKSPGQIADELRQTAAENSNDADNARMVMRCLQDLASPS